MPDLFLYLKEIGFLEASGGQWISRRGFVYSKQLIADYALTAYRPPIVRWVCYPATDVTEKRPVAPMMQK